MDNSTTFRFQNLVESSKYIRALYLDIDVQLELDFSYPMDKFTWEMINASAFWQAQLLRIESSTVELDHEILDSMEDILAQAFSHIEAVRFAHAMHQLCLSDDASDAYEPPLTSLDDPSTPEPIVNEAQCGYDLIDAIDEPFFDDFDFALFLDDNEIEHSYVRDLTRENIESNPGPSQHSTLRQNRSSNVSSTTQQLQKLARLTKDDSLRKLAQRASKQGKSHVAYDYGDYPVAQVGGEYIEVKQEPPLPCERCGFAKCECLIKRASLAAAVASIISSLVKIAETILSSQTAQVGPGVQNAQVGYKILDRIIFGDGGAASVVKDAVHGAVSDALDSELPGVHIKVRTALKIILSLMGFFMLYRMGCITYDVAMLLLTFFQTEDQHVAQVANSWFAYNQKSSFDSENIWEKAIAFVPSAIAMVLSCLVAFGVGKLPGRDNSPESWMRKITMFPRLCSAQKDIFTTIQTYIKPLWKKFEIEVLGHDATLLDDAIPQITSWLAEIEYFSHKSNLDRVCNEKSGRYAIASLYAIGNRLLLNYASALTPEYKGAMQRGMTTAAKLRTYVEDKFPDVKTVRNAPLAIWLVGESQIGKSRLQYLIALELCKAAGLTDLENEIYMRCAEQVFWDGALKQFVTILDDFGQQKDSTSNPNIEFFELIRMIGPFPYPLHMASLNEKNCTRFASSVVMCSTNNRHLHVESLTYEDAVWNRLTQSWEVRVKPEFLKHEARGNRVLTKLDLPKIRDNLPGWEINPYIYEFVRFDARLRNEDDPYTGERLEWDDFIAELKRDLLERLSDGNKLNDWLTRHMKEETPKPVREQQYAQVGIHDIIDIYAQSGETTFGTRNNLKLEQLLSWMTSLEADPLNQDDSLVPMYRAYSAYERRECNKDPKDVDLCDHIPKMIPDRMWDLLIIAYLKHRDSGSNTSRVMKMCADIYAGAIERIPQTLKSVYTIVKSTCMSIINGTWDFVKEHKLAVIGLGIFSYWMNKWMTAPKKEEVVPNQSESDPRVLQPRSRPSVRAAGKAKATKSSRGKHKAEMGQNINQLDVIDVMRKQQYLLSANYIDGTSSVLGCCTQLVGNIFVMPFHFYTYLENDRPLTVTFNHGDSNKIAVTKNYCDLFDEYVTTTTEDGDPMDLIFFSIPQFMRGKDVTKHFVTDEDLIKLYDRKFTAMITGLDYHEDSHVFTRVGGTCTLPKRDVISVVLNGRKSKEPEIFWAASLIKHNIPTKFGDCGKLISLNTTAVSAKFVGIHISGSKNGDNHGQVLTRDTIMTALAQFDDSSKISLDMPHCVETEQPRLETGVLHKGKLTENIAQSTRTAIVPSKLHGKITPPTTRPALLKPKIINGVMHDPLVEGAKKVGRPCGTVPSDILEMAVNDVRNLVSRKNEANINIEVLSYEDAIQGVEGDELFQPINRTTSPGFPYMNQSKPLSKKGKTNWMGRFDYDFESDQALKLRQDVDELIDACKEDRPIEVIWIDTLKDERRPLEKVAIGKTRIISNGPMHFNIAFRMYFMAALAHLRAGRIYNGIAVGINVWSREWDALASHLVNNADTFIDGDFKEFDGTLMDGVMWEIFHILDSLYNDGNTKIRRNLWYHAVYATRCCRGIVYQTTHGLPSGFVATAEANSLYVNIIFRCVYLQLARNHCPDKDSMAEYNKNVRLVAYGDDNVASIKRTILDWFNMNTIIEQMARYQLTYTPADKGDVVVPYKTIEEISFLKRFFRRVPTKTGTTPYYMCPADLESRLEMLNWTKNTKSCSAPEEALVVNDVIKEIAMHGIHVYNEWVPRIIRAALEVGINDITEESCFYYHHKVISGNSLPQRI